MNCTHDQRTLILTPEGPHHGKELCANPDCRKFLGWAPKPETVARQAENGRRIVALRKLKLPIFEAQFVASLDGQGPKLSPKQQNFLDSLWNRYGEHCPLRSA